MSRRAVVAPAKLALRLGAYPAKLAHEATHIAVSRPFIDDYETALHPLGPTRFHTRERPWWPLRAVAALAPTVVGVALALATAMAHPEAFIAAFTAIPYWILYAVGLPGYLPPDNLLAWVGVDLFWFIYTWPSPEDLAALSPG